MTIKLDLGMFSSKTELLQAVVDKGMLRPTTKDLDALYDTLVKSKGNYNFVFTNRSKLSGDISVYFRMIEMAIEDASKRQTGITIKSYFYEEE